MLTESQETQVGLQRERAKALRFLTRKEFAAELGVEIEVDTKNPNKTVKQYRDADKAIDDAMASGEYETKSFPTGTTVSRVVAVTHYRKIEPTEEPVEEN